MFYDFYLPISDLKALGVTSATKLRMLGATTMNTSPVIGNNSVSDFGGVNDKNYPNNDSIMVKFIKNETAIKPSDIGTLTYIQAQSDCPIISGTINTSSTSISGTSTEANTTIIKVYKNGTLIGSATVTSGAWTLSGISALYAGDIITATAQAPFKSVSIDNCSPKTVMSKCSDPVNSTYVTINTKGACGSAGAGISTAQIRLYSSAGVLQGDGTVYSVASDGSFTWKCNSSNSNCSSGNGCLTNNSAYYVTQQLSGQCESDKVWLCLGGTPSATPKINTNPILTSTTTITGTGTTGATLYLYSGSTQIGSPATVSSGTWSITVTPQTLCSSITAKQIVTGYCLSAASTAVGVTQKASTPAISGSYCVATNGTSITISGATSESSSATIELFRTGPVSLGTTTVNSYGLWTKSVAVNSGWVIWATAVDASKCKNTSDNSASITIGTKSTNSGAITGSYYEGGTSVTGTGTNGTTVNLYLDKVLIGTTTVSSGSWTFSGLSASLLYAGGILEVSTTSAGNCESDLAGSVTVQCTAPLNNQTLQQITTTVCAGIDYATFTLANSESGVIYTPVKASDHTVLGYSVSGTGGDITLTLQPLTTNPTVITVKASKYSPVTCESYNINSLSITVKSVPSISSTTPASVCGTGTVGLAAASSGTINWYAASAGGSSLATGTSFTTPSISTTTTYYVDATTNGCTTASRTAVTATANPIPTIVTTTAGSTCSSGTVRLSAASSSGTINWYSAASGGSSLATGTSYTTTSISTTTTYYVDATANSCTTASRTSVTATVTSTVPAQPGSITGSGTVCSGQTGVTYSISSVSNATSYTWSVPTGSSVSGGTGTSAITVTFATTSGNVSVTAGNSCGTSSPRTLAVTVNAAPAQPGTITGTGTVCSGQTGVAFSIASVSGATGYTWSVPTGSSVTAGSGTTAVTVTFGSTSGNVAVTANNSNCSSASRTLAITVNTIPAQPGAISGNATACSGQTGANFSISSVTGATSYTWSVPAGSSITSGSGTIAIIATLGSSSGNVSVTSANSCGSYAATTFAVTINSAIPSQPGTITGTGTVCSGQSGITYSISSVSGATSYTWSVPSGATITSGDGTTSITVDFAATSDNISVTAYNGCGYSSARTTPITINSVPYISSFTTDTRCGTGTVNLGAAASAGTINWYAAASGGSSLATGTSYAPSASTTTAYYIDATANGCTSTSRTEVSATVKTVPTINSTTPSSRCDAGTISLGATASAGTINWYAASSGGSSLGSGASYTTPSISSTTSYYVDATYNSCTTISRTSVTATINNTPTINTTTDNSRCGSGVVSLGANASAGTINWYAAASGGSSLGTGTTFNTPGIASTTSYYVDATANSCTTASRTSVTATVNTVPTISSTTPGSICGTGTVSLGATASAGTINWYAASSGGASLGTGTSFTTASISSTTSYYVDATANGCTTASRTTVTASIGSNPTISSVSDGSRCGTGVVSLGATASAVTINWFAASSGGSSLGTGTSFNTPSISTTTTYYAEATNNGCTSVSRTAVSATINTSPTINSVSDNSRCGKGIVSLGAAASAGTINWYAAASGGSSLGTGTSFTTASINITTSYYVDATANSCTTASRTAVIATVNATPTVSSTTPGNGCGTGTVSLGATASAGTINWYAASSGGSSLGSGASYTTPSISSTTSYYAEADNNGCTSASRSAVTATVNAVPAITGSTPASRCGDGTLSLGATASTGTINWYAASSGGSSLGTGTSFTTPSLGSTTSYYADASANGCTSSSRTTVTATIKPLPAITATTPDSKVGAGNVALGANADMGTINWYAASSGGASLGTGTSYTTPVISVSTTYYVDATYNGCTSSERTSISASIYSAPQIDGTTPASRCNTGTVTLQATASDGTINWYAASTGVALLGTGNSFTTPGISSTTTYYVDATYSGITTPARTAIVATVYNSPAISSTTPASLCGSGSLTIGANASAGTVSWFAASSGGSSLGTGTSFDTPSISTTTSYYAEATNNGCISASRTAVTATINAIPAITSTSPASRTGTGTVNLGATASAGTINWYAAATGGSSLGTGTSFTTPGISSTTTYYVDATANGCTTASRTPVTATINGLPTFTWTAGAGTTDWNNPSNWSGNQVPSSSDDVTIPTHPSGGNIFPAVTSNSQCKDITVGSGASLSINSGITLSVYGDFSNSGTNTFGIGTISMSGSAAQVISGYNTFTNLTINNSHGVSLSGNTEITDILTTTSGTLTTNNHLTLLSDLSKFGIISGAGSGSVSGNVNVQKQFIDYKRYYYISSPVSCSFSQIQNFINITGWGASYKNGQWSNVWKYDETDVSQVPHPDGVRMNGWIAPNGGSETMQAIRGYALYVDAVKTLKLNLNGSVNNGLVSIPVYHTSSVSNGGDPNDDGWNLIGNPYPSPIDWEAAAGSWVKTNVDNATYFFEFTSQYGGMYKSFVNGVGNPSGVSGIIGPMQGFFTHTSANGTISINNNARVNNCTQHFYKKTENKQIFRLQAYNKNTPDAADETAIYFSDNSSLSFNTDFDALKMMNTGEDYPNIYSMTDANMKLSIYAIPSKFDNEVAIPLGIKVPSSGSFVLNASEINNIDITTDIFIVDMLTNTAQNLRENPVYTFDLNQEITEGRFYIKFNSKIENTGINNLDADNIFHTFISGKSLKMSYSSSLNREATLNICNIIGQDVINQQKIKNGNYQYNLSNGTYILRLISYNKTYTRKIIIE